MKITVNNFYSIDDLPLTEKQKRMVLMWFARKLWTLLEEGSGKPEYCCKRYDPLEFDGEDANLCHSYVFDLEDGGRHHRFRDLAHLEEMLMNEGIAEIRQMICEEDLPF